MTPAELAAVRKRIAEIRSDTALARVVDAEHARSRAALTLFTMPPAQHKPSARSGRILRVVNGTEDVTF